MGVLPPPVRHPFREPVTHLPDQPGCLSAFEAAGSQLINPWLAGQRAGPVDEVVVSVLSASGVMTPARRLTQPYLSQMLKDKHLPGPPPPTAFFSSTDARPAPCSFGKDLLNGSSSFNPPKWLGPLPPPLMPEGNGGGGGSGGKPVVFLFSILPSSHPSLSTWGRSLSSPPTCSCFLPVHLSSSPPPFTPRPRPRPSPAPRLGSGAANRCCLLLIWVLSD